MTGTLADLAVVLLVLVSALLAYARGVTREVLAIGGWVLAGLGSFFLAPILEPLIREIPYVGEFLRSSCTLSLLAAFAVAFGFILVVLSIFTPLVSGVIRDSALGPVDRFLGFLFGVARGVVLVAVLWLLYDLAVPQAQRVEAIESARSARLIAGAADIIRAYVPERVPDWLGARIDGLMGVCDDAPGPRPTATAA
jgi:membrane protein required for colicin V production